MQYIATIVLNLLFPQRDLLSVISSPLCLCSIMVDFFLNRVLVENNWDQDELNTEREITGILENRILMLLFACAECDKCWEFVPVLNDFFKRLKDPAYIEYPRLLALIYIRYLPASLLVYMSPHKMNSCVFT